MSLASHDVDLLDWLLGPVESRSAQGTTVATRRLSLWPLRASPCVPLRRPASTREAAWLPPQAPRPPSPNNAQSRRPPASARFRRLPHELQPPGVCPPPYPHSMPPSPPATNLWSSELSKLTAKAAPATHRCWWLHRSAPAASWAGNRATPNSARSSATPGPGTKP